MSNRPHDDLIALLAPRMNDVRARQTFLASAWGSSKPTLFGLDYNLPARDFILHLCQKIAPNTAQLDAILDELKRRLGRDDEIEALRPRLHRWLSAGARDADTPKLLLFLSYARADDAGSDRAAYDDPARSFMRRLYDALTGEFDLWWDMVSMPSRGETFTAEIADAVAACDWLVLVVAPGALASDYVRAEWTHALRLCKPVTPILRAGGYDAIPAELREYHAPDFRDPRPFDEAVEELRRVLRQPPLPLGELCNFERGLPEGHIERKAPFQAARQALLTDAVSATVVSTAAPSATAIYGQGGLGKSTLAAALAHDCAVRRRYPDGILWVKVTQTPNIQARLADIGVHFGDARDAYVGPGTDSESAAARLNAVLRAKRALLILDDVWDHRLVSYFRTAGTPCRLLITTRSAALAAKIDGADVRLERLSDAEGAQLIAARAGGSADDPIYLAISRELGGHTLAVTLAAARLKKRGANYAQAILDGLRRPTDPFASLTVDPDDKDLNLSRSLKLSYDALSEDLQRRFRALGVFAVEAAFDLKALAAVWGEAEDAADRAAEALTDASLLDFANGRYSQHRVLRAYARALLTEAGELDAIFLRYADWVTEQAQQFENPPETWRDTIERDLPHVLAVGDGLVERQEQPDFQTLALAFATNTNRFLGYRREYQRRAWLEMGLALSRAAGDQRREGAFLNSIGGAWSALGDQRKALDYYEQALPLSRAVGDRGGEATTLNNIGLAWSALGDQRKALDYCEQALPLFRAVGDRGGEAGTLTNIGGAWSALGDQRKALDYYEQALPLFRAVGDRGGEATTLNNIGRVWSALGDKRKALDYYEQALPLRRAVGDRGGEATTLTNIGGAWSALGDQRKALDYCEQALPLFRAVGDRGGEATTLNNIGGAWSALGDQRKALDYYEQALPLFRAVGDRGGEATTLTNIGGAWDALGDKRKALDYYEQALPLRRAVGDRGGEATTLNNIGRAWDALGDQRKALDYYEQALPLSRAVGDRGGEATTLNNIGLAWSALGDQRKALDYYEQALPLFRAVGDRGGEATTLTNIGGAWDALGDKRKALDYYEQALPLFRAVGDRGGEAVTCFNIGMVYRSLGDLDQATAYVERCVQLDIEIEHPDLEHDRRVLEQLKRERAGGGSPPPSQADPFEQVMAVLFQVYALGGEAAVRALLKDAGLPEDEVERIIRSLSDTQD